MKCQRCGKETNAFMVSMFNTDECCLDCIERERQHPDYQKAKDAEHQAVLRGDYNFPGIGLPEDLKP